MQNDYLSAADRAEIERAHAREPAHKIARRLGLPTRTVKAEVRRLRRADPTPSAGARPPRMWAALAVVVALCAGAGAGAIALVRPASEPATESVVTRAATPEAKREPELGREPALARDLYARLDRNEAPDPADVLRRLKSDDEAIRLAAARAYTKFPSPDRDPTPLLSLLNDPARRVRLAALQGIGRMGDDRAVPSLIALLSADRPIAEHHLAVSALGRTPTERSLEALIGLLAHEAPHTRTEVFDALSRMLDDDLGFTQADLQSDFEAVQTAFRKHLDARRRAS